MGIYRPSGFGFSGSGVGSLGYLGSSQLRSRICSELSVDALTFWTFTSLDNP